MKKFITFSLLLTLITGSLVGCGNSDHDHSHDSPDLIADIENLSSPRSYTNEQITLQRMGTWRDVDDETYYTAVNMGIIPKDKDQNDIVTKEELLEIIDKNLCGQAFLLTEHDNIYNLNLPEEIKVKHLVSLMADMLTSFTAYNENEVFSEEMFRSMFTLKHNDLTSYDSNFIDRMAFLRAKDALLINVDDVMILENDLTYEMLAQGLLRIVDLRVEQLTLQYYPDECTKCNTPIEDWYELVNSLDNYYDEDQLNTTIHFEEIGSPLNIIIVDNSDVKTIEELLTEEHNFDYGDEHNHDHSHEHDEEPIIETIYLDDIPEGIELYNAVTGELINPDDYK